MILFFRFKNFRTFHQETLVNMQAAGYRELPEHLAAFSLSFSKKDPAQISGVSIAAARSDKKLIKALAVYGPNASGKSHIISALQFYYEFVSRQLLPPSPERMKLRSLLSPYPFLLEMHTELSASSELPLSMCMQFFSQGYLFEYGFTLSGAEVTEETFLIDKRVIFQKNTEELCPGRSFRSFLQKKIPLKTKGSSLGIFLNYDTGELTEAGQAFASFFQQAFLTFDHSCLFRVNPLLPSFGGIQAKKILALPYAGDFICRHLREMQLPVPSSEDMFSDQLDPLLCSTGLIKIILLLYRYYCLQQTGGILIVDDLTAFLHPNVSRHLLKLFQSPDSRNLQLIFTTHDTALLNRSQFRRDEVAIVNMDQAGFSHLHTLADIRVRADASFSKDYLAGKYGILPVWEETGQ